MRWLVVLAAGSLLACGASARGQGGERLANPGFEEKARGWQAFERGFVVADAGRQGAALRCVNAAADERRGAFQTVVLNQKAATPVLVSGWSRAEGVGGSPNPDYSLYVDVLYVDGDHLWGQAAPFATGTHGWQRQRVLIGARKPIRSLNVYALFRQHAGAADFDDFSAVELSGRAVFDSQPLAPPRLPPGTRSGWFVRDVAADGPLAASLPGLRLVTRIDGDTVRATLTGTDGRERAVTLYYVERFAGEDARWGNDIRQTLPAARVERAHVVPVALGAAGAASLYPFGCVTAVRGGKREGRALGIPADQGPRIARIGYQGDAGLLYAAFDLALAPAAGKPGAEASVVRFPVDPAWGFRDAAARYAARYPAAFRRRLREDGLWIPFVDPSKVAGLADFSIAFHEGDNSVQSDDRLGIRSFRYTEPMSWWMVMPPEMPRTYEEALALANAKAAGSDPEEKRWAQALLHSGAQGPDGRFVGDFRNEPWANGMAWSLSPDPKLPHPPGEATKADLVYRARVADGRYKKGDSGLDGEYLDSLEMWADLPNYRPEQLRATALPLTFAADTLRPVVPMGFSVWEMARAMSDDLHRRGKWLMANSTPIRFWAFAPLLDLMGIETNWLPGGKWEPESDARMNLWRTLSGKKPYLLLQNTDFEAFAPYVERYFMRALFYGIFPSFFSIDAANDNYWERPKWHNRDRALFRKYLPTIRALSAAGWEPVTYARADRASVWLERFGKAYLTVLNASREATTATVTVEVGEWFGPPPPGAVLTVRDALTGETLARAPARALGKIPLRLAGERARALRLSLEKGR